jgi:hypothetical protein
MSDYDLIKEKLIDFQATDDNKLFIQYLIVQKCISILEFAQESIINGKGSLIAPQLREVFEYTVILAGLDEFVPLSQFINHEKNDQFVRKIRDKMESFALRNSKYEGAIFKGFTKVLYDTLSEFTHANIDNLMRFSIDMYSDENEKSIFIDDSQILFDFVNSLFLMAIYSLLKIDKQTKLLKEERLVNISKKLKPNHLKSNDIYNRILSVEGIRLRYINKIKDLKTMKDEKEKE